MMEKHVVEQNVEAENPQQITKTGKMMILSNPVHDDILP